MSRSMSFMCGSPSLYFIFEHVRACFSSSLLHTVVILNGCLHITEEFRFIIEPLVSPERFATRNRAKDA